MNKMLFSTHEMRIHIRLRECAPSLKYNQGKSKIEHTLDRIAAAVEQLLFIIDLLAYCLEKERCSARRYGIEKKSNQSILLRTVNNIILLLFYDTSHTT